MNASSFSALVRLAASPGVRRISLCAGCVAALCVGGMPFAFGPATVMGRVVLLPSVLGFALHLTLAVLYGALFSLVLWRTRDWATPLATIAAALLFHCGTAALFMAWELPAVAIDGRALAAHFIFAGSFALCFKLAEIGDPEPRGAA